MAKSTIGIVTVLYNCAPVLEDFFKSLDEQTFRDFTLYVVDNNSSDDGLAVSRRMASEVNFPVVFIPEKENWGVAKGNNLGIRRALDDGCSYVLLANNDTEFGPETIGTMLSSMKANDCALLVPKILNYFTGRIWCAGGGYGWKNPTYHIGRPKKADACSKPRYVDYSPTCFMLIKREVFEKVGMMDETYFVYFDDTDFVWRSVKLHGFRLYYEPSALVQHKINSSTSKAPSFFALHYHHRNSVYFMNKYFPWYRRWSVYTYNTVIYWLKTIKHPEYPRISEFLGYYREGLDMYRASIAKKP